MSEPTFPVPDPGQPDPIIPGAHPEDDPSDPTPHPEPNPHAVTENG